MRLKPWTLEFGVLFKLSEPGENVLKTPSIGLKMQKIRLKLYQYIFKLTLPLGYCLRLFNIVWIFCVQLLTIAFNLVYSKNLKSEVS